MYLDPSFGGMFLQIIVALIAGGGAILFGMRRQIKALFKKDKSKGINTLQTNNTSNEDVIDMMEDK